MWRLLYDNFYEWWKFDDTYHFFFNSCFNFVFSLASWLMRFWYSFLIYSSAWSYFSSICIVFRLISLLSLSASLSFSSNYLTLVLLKSDYFVILVSIFLFNFETSSSRQSLSFCNIEILDFNWVLSLVASRAVALSLSTCRLISLF